MMYIKLLDRWLIFVNALKWVVFSYYTKCVYIWGKSSGINIVISFIIIFIISELFSFCLQNIVKDIVDILASKNKKYLETPSNWQYKGVDQFNNIKKELIYPSEWYKNPESKYDKEYNNSVKITIYLLVFLIGIIVLIYAPIVNGLRESGFIIKALIFN